MLPLHSKSVIINAFNKNFHKTKLGENLFFNLPGFCLFVGNLNSNKDFEEIKSSLRKFFSKNDLEVADVRLGGSK